MSVLLPGDRVRVRPWSQVEPTLDADQALDGLTFMPEMLTYCGQTLRVAFRAERTCVHPPELPFRRLKDAVVLQGVRCDGAFHGGCQLGCMVFWKEAWLEKLSVNTAEAGAGVDGGDVARDDEPVPEVGPRAVSSSDPERYVCQATALPVATRPGAPFWTPGQYVRMLRVRTFTIPGLVSMFARPARRRGMRLLRSALGRQPRPDAAVEAASGLQPGEWVEVLSRDQILRTLDEHGTHRGLAFGGDMAEQCGRRMRVLERVDRIIVEATGHLRSVHDTVILDGSICDRYLGCARGMPFLWREAWLRRVDAPVGAEGPAPSPAGAGGGAGGGRIGRWSLAVKRGMDLAGAAAACLVLAPVLAWTALLVAASDGLPILFRHERPGLRGKPFRIYKFRTMRPPTPGEVWYLTDDDRISRLGRFLRASSIDELPELWNVLRGDMSLVGPRPLLAEYLATYTPEERRRHDMRPGITGWAAVNGRHALRFEDRLKLDVWYVDHWSLWLDLRIIAMTVGHVLRRTHVSTTQDLEAVGFPLPGVGGTPLASPERPDGQGATEPRAAAVGAAAAVATDRPPVGVGR